MAMRHRNRDGEPSINEMLNDPVITAVMTRDGVTEEDLHRLIDTARSESTRDRIQRGKPSA